MNEDIRRRIQSARVLLDELKASNLEGGDFDELCALASHLEFQVAELEADLSALEAV
jgi:hypothetical protein